jgi:hypothetical protein
MICDQGRIFSSVSHSNVGSHGGLLALIWAFRLDFPSSMRNHVALLEMVQAPVHAR